MIRGRDAPRDGCYARICSPRGIADIARSGGSQFYGIILFFFIVATLAGTPCAAWQDDLKMPGPRLRIVWGGGSPRNWQGSLKLSGGTMKIAAVLGMETDSAAGLSVGDDGSTLHLHAIRPTSFGGAEIELDCDDQAELEVSLFDELAPDKIVNHRIPLGPVLARNGEAARIGLDESGNVLDVRGSANNAIRVQIDRPHLVFDKGESFRFRVALDRSWASGARSQTLRVRVTPARSNETTSSETMTIPASAVPEPLDVDLQLPDEEGAWNVRLELVESSLPARIGLAGSSAGRIVQVVTVDRDGGQPQPNDKLADLWQEVMLVGGKGSPWFPASQTFSPFRLASDAATPGSGCEPLEHEGQSCASLSPGGWHVVPLKISRPGLPHLVQVEYIDRGPMSVGISVLQPDSSRAIPQFDTDSGIHVPDKPAPEEPVIRQHQFFIWPRERNPWLLFANRHAEQSAAIVSVRVLAGPEKLARMPAVATTSGSNRQYLALYEVPVFVENFSVSRFYDEATGQTIDDWQSWLAGARRWAEYLRASGYTGAMLVVAGSGSSLYPSSLLQPTPRFDNGALASIPCDPMRKDVVELILRVFESENIALVPLLHFDSPLPALEQARNHEPGTTTSILLKNTTGETRLAAFRASRDGVAIYNPLERRVQDALLDVIREFRSRYREHDFAQGTGLVLSRGSVPVIPGQSWGIDPEIVREFARDREIALPEAGREREFMDRALNGKARLDWLNWRSAKVAGLFQKTSDLLAEFTADRPAAGNRRNLYLVATDAFELQDAFSVLAPSLRRNPDLNEACARIGIPVRAIQDNPDWFLLRPGEIAPEKSLAELRLKYQLDIPVEASSADSSGGKGLLLSRRCTSAHFENLQKSSPLGHPAEQPLVRLQPLVAAGPWARQPMIDGLVSGDASLVVDGGWVTAFGQESAVGEMMEQFVQLPDVPFTSIDTTGKSAAVARQAIVDGKNWFYVMNPMPWPVTVSLVFENNATVAESLAGSRWLMTEESESTVRLDLKLQPFDFQAGTAEPAVAIRTIRTQVDSRVTANLQARLDWLISRVSIAEQAEPMAVINNPGFEPAANEEKNGFGWYYDPAQEAAFALQSSRPQSGKTSLVMASEGAPVWIRSNDFAPPVTGRLSVSVQLRTSDPSLQPPLRISVQGSDGDQVYYRFGSIGSGEPESQKLGDEWKEFAVHFDDVPIAEGRPLRIGFDLMGAGQVEIDEVRVFDRWFDRQDSNAITQRLQVAGYQLTQGENVDKCRRILDGYWARFLQQYFPEDPVASPTPPIANTAGMKTIAEPGKK